MKKISFFILCFIVIAICTYLAGTSEYKKWGYTGFVVFMVVMLVGGYLAGKKLK